MTKLRTGKCILCTWHECIKKKSNVIWHIPTTKNHTRHSYVVSSKHSRLASCNKHTLVHRQTTIFGTSAQCSHDLFQSDGVQSSKSAFLRLHGQKTHRPAQTVVTYDNTRTCLMYPCWSDTIFVLVLDTEPILLGHKFNISYLLSQLLHSYPVFLVFNTQNVRQNLSNDIFINSKIF